MSELDSQEWGLCDRFPVYVDLEDDCDDEWDDDDDEEWPLEHMARLAAEIEGRPRRGAARLETRPPGSAHPGMDDPVGAALRHHPDRRMAPGAFGAVPPAFLTRTHSGPRPG